MGNRTMQQLKKVLDPASFASNSSFLLLQAFSNFHLLLFVAESGVLDAETMSIICKAVLEKKADLLEGLHGMESWATLKMILAETSAASGSGGGGAGYGGGGGGGGASSSGSGPWACRHCTFNNDSGSSCDMCGLPRD